MANVKNRKKNHPLASSRSKPKECKEPKKLCLDFKFAGTVSGNDKAGLEGRELQIFMFKNVRDMASGVGGRFVGLTEFSKVQTIEHSALHQVEYVIDAKLIEDVQGKYHKVLLERGVGGKAENAIAAVHETPYQLRIRFCRLMMNDPRSREKAAIDFRYFAKDGTDPDSLSELQIDHIIHILFFLAKGMPLFENFECMRREGIRRRQAQKRALELRIQSLTQELEVLERKNAEKAEQIQAELAKKQLDSQTAKALLDEVTANLEAAKQELKASESGKVEAEKEVLKRCRTNRPDSAVVTRVMARAHYHAENIDSLKKRICKLEVSAQKSAASLRTKQRLAGFAESNSLHELSELKKQVDSLREVLRVVQMDN